MMVQRPPYPITRKVEQYDDYFGIIVHDPYRWLEEENSDEVAKWVAEQNKFTESYLDQIPFRDAMRRRIEQLWNYTRCVATRKIGERYFFFKNDGLQDQPVLSVKDSLGGETQVFLDPNTFSDDGTQAITEIAFSHDDRYLAYAVSQSGSDYYEIRVVEIETGKHLPDTIEWATGAPAWHKTGFYYNRYDKPEEAIYTGIRQFVKIYYHRVGDDQSEDELVSEDTANPEISFALVTTEHEHSEFLIEYDSNFPGNRLSVRDMRQQNSQFVPLHRDANHICSPIDEVDGKIIIRTDLDAPTGRIVLADPLMDSTQWRTLVPAREETLDSVWYMGKRIIAIYIKDATNHAYVYTVDGTFLHEIALPGIGQILGLTGKNGDDTVFYEFTSFTQPRTTYAYNINSNTSEVFFKPELPFETSEYLTDQVFFSSKDGTRVPMFIVHQRNLARDGNNPTLLYGYGGFGISPMPIFNPTIIAFLEQGGIYAHANIRGGGEYGQAWHEAGMKQKKQNVFDDFIAAAEYLITEKYTSPERLAMSGASNGGLLVGAVMAQRPDLFRVALPAQGVLDMLRYHKFTVGWDWAYEYGTSNDRTEFENILRYSPLHNLKPGVKYPATLLRTADHDDRVVPAHSFKFIARLQACSIGEHPMLISIATKAGHGAGTPVTRAIRQTADDYAFLFHAMQWPISIPIA